MNGKEDSVIERLRSYLKIPSVHPDVDYSGCVKFLQDQAKSLGLPVAVYEFVPKKPVVIITCKGLQPELPSILLNSHMDVVPVYEEHWTHPPFEAVISKDGWIYARGAQDMKSIGMMHLEAVRSLRKSGSPLRRTVHISFVPDEEIGGVDGMKKFSESPEFKALNIGFALDESIPSGSANEVLAYNGERIFRAIKVTCRGEPGHGSLLNTNTAGEKVHYIINKFSQFRESERKKLEYGKAIGDVITVNLTIMEGGVQFNVLPESLSVSFDMRIPPDADLDYIEYMIQSWCKEAGSDVSFEYHVKNPHVNSTKIDGSVPFWTAIEAAASDLKIKINTVTSAGATDARYVRLQGIPAINFSPILNVPMLLHAHDERIHIDSYRRGIEIMTRVVKEVANV
ncbi:hypothetical protein ACJJTC_008916 [Scirpophaga incertulas]